MLTSVVGMIGIYGRIMLSILHSPLLLLHLPLHHPHFHDLCLYPLLLIFPVFVDARINSLHRSRGPLGFFKDCVTRWDTCWWLIKSFPVATSRENNRVRTCIVRLYNVWVSGRRGRGVGGPSGCCGLDLFFDRRDESDGRGWGSSLLSTSRIKIDIIQFYIQGEMEKFS